MAIHAYKYNQDLNSLVLPYLEYPSSCINSAVDPIAAKMAHLEILDCREYMVFHVKLYDRHFRPTPWISTMRDQRGFDTDPSICIEYWEPWFHEAVVAHGDTTLRSYTQYLLENQAKWVHRLRCKRGDSFYFFTAGSDVALPDTTKLEHLMLMDRMVSYENPLHLVLCPKWDGEIGVWPDCRARTTKQVIPHIFKTRYVCPVDPPVYSNIK